MAGLDEKTKSDESDRSRTYYRVPCELQIRFRRLDNEELKVFSSFAMRPSPHSNLKTEIEQQLQGIGIREESKTLFEKAFQLLLNLDQRLERIEEQLASLASGAKSTLDSYEWVHGDIGAGGLAFFPESKNPLLKGEKLLMDIILPTLPEHRFVVAAEVSHIDEVGKVGTKFISIHEDDREFIHRFVISREREILRLRALERERKKDKDTDSAR